MVKDQGVIHEAAPNFVGFDGRWIRLPGSSDAYLSYISPGGIAVSAITFGCRIRSLGATGDHRCLMCDWDEPGGDDRYLLDVTTDDEARTYIQISGTPRGVTGSAFADIVQEKSVACTWTSGDYIRLYVSGIQDAISPATYAGTIDEGPQGLYLGARNDEDYPLNGHLADPFVDTSRAWSAAEILAWHNRSLF